MAETSHSWTRPPPLRSAHVARRLQQKRARFLRPPTSEQPQLASPTPRKIQGSLRAATQTSTPPELQPPPQGLRQASPPPHKFPPRPNPPHSPFPSPPSPQSAPPYLRP